MNHKEQLNVQLQRDNVVREKNNTKEMTQTFVWSINHVAFYLISLFIDNSFALPLQWSWLASYLYNGRDWLAAKHHTRSITFLNCRPFNLSLSVFSHLEGSANYWEVCISRLPITRHFEVDFASHYCRGVSLWFAFNIWLFLNTQDFYHILHEEINRSHELFCKEECGNPL